jgi:hypothetical protein
MATLESKKEKKKKNRGGLPVQLYNSPVVGLAIPRVVDYVTYSLESWPI